MRYVCGFSAACKSAEPVSRYLVFDLIFSVGSRSGASSVGRSVVLVSTKSRATGQGFSEGHVFGVLQEASPKNMPSTQRDK